ncbi:MAG: amidohydrolase, partial [Limnohabitans sp.]|nr:amidohydrolase [Limnohabitans sp.]
MLPNDSPVTQRCVTLIDAHHHLWDLTAHHYPWLQDQTEPHFFMGNYE